MSSGQGTEQKCYKGQASRGAERMEGLLMTREPQNLAGRAGQQARLGSRGEAGSGVRGKGRAGSLSPGAVGEGGRARGQLLAEAARRALASESPLEAVYLQHVGLGAFLPKEGLQTVWFYFLCLFSIQRKEN